MRVAVLSGKGGTGKTMVSVNLAAAAGEALYVDCDVEEPNGHLFFRPVDVQEEEVAIPIPKVDTTLCNGCRTCVDFCRFNALAYALDRVMVFEEVCHSCGGCALICPERAIAEREKGIGAVQRGVSEKVEVISGMLDPGVATGMPIIKKLLSELGPEDERTVLIDCPPGSACATVECIKGADYCILVGEPTLFSAHDLGMVHELVGLLGKPCGAVLNKCLYGHDPSEEFCREHGVPILGRIPFDDELGRLSADAKVAVREKERYRSMFSVLLRTVAKEAE